MRELVLASVLSFFTALPAAAITKQMAEVCISKLLQCYAEQRDCSSYINVPEVLQRALGPAMRVVYISRDEHQLLLQVSRSVISDAFTNGTRYQFSNITIDTVRGGKAVDGRVHVRSPQFDDETTFTALTNGQCVVKEVRIAGVKTLSGGLRESLRKDSRTRRLMRRIEDDYGR